MLCVTNRVAYNNKCPVPLVTGVPCHAKIMSCTMACKLFAANKDRNFSVFLFIVYFTIYFIYLFIFISFIYLIQLIN